MIRSARAPAVAARLGRGGVGVGVGNAAGLAWAAADDGAPARVRGRGGARGNALPVGLAGADAHPAHRRLLPLPLQRVPGHNRGVI